MFLRDHLGVVRQIEFSPLSNSVCINVTTTVPLGVESETRQYWYKTPEGTTLNPTEAMFHLLVQVLGGTMEDSVYFLEDLEHQWEVTYEAFQNYNPQLRKPYTLGEMQAEAKLREQEDIRRRNEQHEQEDDIFGVDPTTQ